MLHGLARSAGSMASLAEQLDAAGYQVWNLDYDSRDKTPDELVEDLGRAVADCCASPERPLHFVAHSLGGILVRAYLENGRPANLGRVVLLAPPNGGSEIVDSLGDSPAFEAFFGPTAVQLGTDEDSLPNRLGPPDYEVGVIAGQQSINPLGSVMLPGLDDGTVTVESARLEGAADFILVDASHTFIMDDPDAQRQVLHFLRTGSFDHPPGPGENPVPK